MTEPTDPGRRQDSPEPTPRRRLPRRVLLRLVLLGVVVVAAVAVLRFTPLMEMLDKDRLAAFFDAVRSRWWSPLVLIGLFVLTSPIGLPASPLLIAGAVVFGLPGILWNLIGLYLGALVSYLLGRSLGHEVVSHFLPDRLSAIERWIEQHGFWSLVRIRLLPVPFPLVNYGAALAGVKLPTFLLTTALGLLPAVTVYSYFVAALTRAVGGDRTALGLQLGAAFVAMFALSFLPGWLQRRAAKRGDGGP